MAQGDDSYSSIPEISSASLRSLMHINEQCLKLQFLSVNDYRGSIKVDSYSNCKRYLLYFISIKEQLKMLNMNCDKDD